MGERATQWKRQGGMNIIHNSPMTMRPLTDYEWKRNTMEETGRDQYHSEFPDDNQTTYFLWMREQHSGRDKQGSTSFIIPQWQSDHLPTMSERGTQWKGQAGISMILNSPMTIRPLTVRCKTVAMSNPKPGHEVPCNQLWEFHFALVGTNKV